MQLKTLKTNTCWSRIKIFDSKGFLQRRKRRNMTIEVVYQPPARRWVPADSIISTSAGSHPMLTESSTQNRSIGVNCTIGKFLFLFFYKLVALDHHQSLSTNFVGDIPHRCDNCKGPNDDMVITEIDRMYKLTFEQLCTLSEYPNYWQSIRKLMLVWTRREKLERAHIRMEHLITWCQDRSLSADLISDIPIAQNNNTSNVRAYLSDDTNEANCCQNPKCIQTIGVRERTLLQIIEEYGQYNDGILYQENFNAMIREIHQCGTCKCPKTVLELAKVFRHTYYTIRFSILLTFTPRHKIPIFKEKLNFRDQSGD